MSWKKTIKLTKVISAKFTDQDYVLLTEMAQKYYSERLIGAPTTSELIRYICKKFIEQRPRKPSPVQQIQPAAAISQGPVGVAEKFINDLNKATDFPADFLKSQHQT